MAESCDVVIIGAGLAGLVAARVLCGAGLEVVVVEADEQPGGRVRTDRVDGLLLDRGFQLLNPSIRRQVAPSISARCGCARSRRAPSSHTARGATVVDPRRSPRDALGALQTAARDGAREGRVRTVGDRGRVRPGGAHQAAATTRPLPRRCSSAACTARSPTGSCARSWPACSARTNCARRGGWPSCWCGRSCAERRRCPRTGCRHCPTSWRALLPDGVLRTSDRPRRSHGSGSTARQDAFDARAVVVATDARVAARLLGDPEPSMRSLTTFYHLAPSSPAARRMLHLDADRRGPVVNTAVLSDVAPTYSTGRVARLVHRARRGRVAAGRTRGTPPCRIIYGVDPRTWQHVATYPIVDALPETPPGTRACGDRSSSATACTWPATTATPRRSRARWCPDAASPRPCAPTSAGSGSDPGRRVRDNLGVHVASTP